MCDNQTFWYFFFKMAAGGHLGFYPFKKALSQPKSTQQNLKVDILGYKNQSLKTIDTKFPGLAEKSCLAIMNYFLYYKELTIKFVPRL